MHSDPTAVQTAYCILCGSELFTLRANGVWRPPARSRRPLHLALRLVTINDGRATFQVTCQVCRETCLVTVTLPSLPYTRAPAAMPLAMSVRGDAKAS